MNQIQNQNANLIYNVPVDWKCPRIPEDQVRGVGERLGIYKCELSAGNSIYTFDKLLATPCDKGLYANAVQYAVKLVR